MTKLSGNYKGATVNKAVSTVIFTVFNPKKVMKYRQDYVQHF